MKFQTLSASLTGLSTITTLIAAFPIEPISTLQALPAIIIPKSASPSSHTPTDISNLQTRDICGVHVTQYQKNEPIWGNKPDYNYFVTIKTASETTIWNSGNVPTGDFKNYPVAGYQNLLAIYSGAVDSDPVTFVYTGVTWNSNDENCSAGKFDGGKREMDCTWACS